MTDAANIPYSIEAEQAVIGGLMLDGRAMDRVASIVTAESFFRYDHQLIFKAVAEVLERQEEADIVTVGDRLGDILDEVGGTAYLASLFNSTPSAANIHHYAKIVADKEKRRRIIQNAQETAREANEAEDPDRVIDEASQRLFSLAESTEEGGFSELKTVLKSSIEDIDRRWNERQQGGHVGIPTGIQRFDDRFGGFQPGDYVIIGGRPSMGKTGLALTMTRNMGEAGYRVGFFSIEMPEIQMAQRLISQRSKVSLEKFRSAAFEDDDWGRITNAVGQLSELPIYIDDQSGVTPGQIYRRARQMKRRHGLDILFIDYLQLMEADELTQSREQEIAKMSRAIAKIGKNLNMAVVVLCQLSRKVEERQDKRPLKSDLRESGSLEQDADIIIFPFRPSEYWEEEPNFMPNPGRPIQETEATLFVEKFRNGPTGNIPCTYIGEQTFFGDRDFREDAA